MQSKSYRPDIDGLRAIAVFIVVAYHAGFSGFSGGYVGVDVFFIISGFLITGMLFNEVKSTGTISLSSFYAKRFKRLYPALLLVITFTILVWGIYFLGIPSKTQSFIKSIRYSIFGFANIFFKKNTGGYFDIASDEMPLLHFWSLAVEEQFYFVWPLFILICAKIKYRSIELKQKVVIALSLLVISSFIISEYLILTQRSSEAFYYMHARAWELGIGGLLYFVAPWFRNKKSYLLNLMAFVGLFFIIGPTVLYQVDSRFPGALALVPVLGTCLIILSGGDEKSFFEKVLSWPLFVKMGVLSYGWYLWHWPLLSFERILFLGELPPLIWRVGAVVLSLLMAQISLSYIESPIRHGKSIKDIKSSKIIIFALAVSVVMSISSTLLGKWERKYALNDLIQLEKYVEEKNVFEFGCDGSQETSRVKHCVADFTGMNKSIHPDVFVWGDSHARAYFPMIEKFASENKLKATLLSGSGMVPLIGVSKIYYSTKSEGLDIAQHNNAILKNLQLQSRKKDVSVILISRWVSYTGKKAISVKDPIIFLENSKSSTRSLNLMKAGLKETLDSLTNAGVKKILIMLPTPEFKYDVLQCSNRKKCDTPKGMFEDYRKDFLGMIKELQREFHNVLLLDPSDVLCQKEICSQVLVDDHGNTIPTVHDDDHVSIQSALFLGRKKDKELMQLIQ